MITNFLLKIKKWILLIVFGASVLAAPVAYDKIQISQIPDDLKLKVKKERVLHYKEIKDKVKYLYISDVEVPVATYQNFTEDISKRTKNAQIFPKGVNEKKNKEFVSRFYAGEPFYKDKDKWFQTETATTTLDAFKKQIKVGFLERLLGNTVFADDFYAGAGDGFIYSEDVGQPDQAGWNTAHDATTGEGANYTLDSATHTGILIWGISDSIQIYKGFFPCVTSGLGVAGVKAEDITGAILKVYPITIYDDYNGSGYDYIAVVQTDQPNPAELTTADFNNCGATDNPDKGSANIDLTGLGTGSYQDFTLNETGIGWIVLDGTTMLGMRVGQDIQDVFEGDPEENQKENSINSYFSEETGTDKDPYLEVTYELPATGSFFMFF